MLKLTEIEIFLLFFLSRKVNGLFLHARSVEGNFSLHVRCAGTDALSPTTRSADDAFSLCGKCVGHV